MRKSGTIFLIAIFLFSFSACSRLSFGPDETNIEDVVKYYYSSKCFTKKGYNLLSSRSRAQISLEQWEQNKLSPAELKEAAKVLRKEESHGVTYALVSVGAKDEHKKEIVVTNTWISEDGKWRRLVLPKTEEEADKALQNGDYAAAKAKAEEWLSIDPFSVEAYRILAFSIDRSGIGALKSGDRSLNDIVRALLAINEDDSQVKFMAVSYTEDLSIARTYLKRLEGDAHYDNAAYNLALKFSDPKERLQFLESQQNERDLLILRLLTLAEMQRWQEFLKIANDRDTVKSIKEDLDLNDPSYSAGYAGKLGLAAYYAGDKTAAQKWLDYGITRDPNNEAVRTLASILSH